jgi:hypothetical protein
MEVKRIAVDPQLVVDLYYKFQTEDEILPLPSGPVHGLTRSVLGHLSGRIDITEAV